jgi:uncharacterized membrane protein
MSPQNDMPDYSSSYLRKVTRKEILRVAIFGVGLMMLVVYMESGSKIAKIIFGVIYAISILYSGFKVSSMTSEQWKRDREELSKSRSWKLFMWGMILILLLLFALPLYGWSVD